MNAIVFFGKTGYNINVVIDIFAKACFESGLQVKSNYNERLQQKGADFQGFIKVDKEPIISKDFPENAQFGLVLGGREKESVKFLEEKANVITNGDKEIFKKVKAKTNIVNQNGVEFLCGALAKMTGMTSLKNLKKVSDRKGFEEGFKAIK